MAILPADCLHRTIPFLDSQSQDSASVVCGQWNSEFTNHTAEKLENSGVSSIFLLWMKKNNDYEGLWDSFSSTKKLKEIRAQVYQVLYQQPSYKDYEEFREKADKFSTASMCPSFYNTVNRILTNAILIDSSIIFRGIKSRFPELAPASPVSLADSLINPVYKAWLGEQITRVDVSHEKLKKLPMIVNGFSGVETINISHNRFHELPECGSFPKLNILLARNNKISDIANWRWPPHLEVLDLSGNPLANLPNQENLPNGLKKIILDSDQIRSFSYLQISCLPIVKDAAPKNILEKAVDSYQDFQHFLGMPLWHFTIPVIHAMAVDFILSS